jgi:rSAM/selenodomain-associated transferase 2
LSAKTVAVVIPTLDEETPLRRCLAAVPGTVNEVVVADGGSRDATVQVASELGARVVTGRQGRGPQMNQGAAAAQSEILLFLHADSVLPDGAIESIQGVVEDGRKGGGFLVRFDDPSPLFRLGSGLVNIRTRVTRIPLGDQAQFVTRSAFEQLGGFRDWPILEDLDFARRLKALGAIAIVGSPVLTSARRYRRNGILRTIANNWSIWCLFAVGVSPPNLAKRYRQVR